MTNETQAIGFCKKHGMQKIVDKLTEEDILIDDCDLSFYESKNPGIWLECGCFIEVEDEK